MLVDKAPNFETGPPAAYMYIKSQRTSPIDIYFSIFFLQKVFCKQNNTKLPTANLNTIRIQIAWQIQQRQPGLQNRSVHAHLSAQHRIAD